MAYELPALKYGYDALEPFIDAETVEIHYSKHHKTYVDRFNSFITGKKEFEAKTGEQIIANIDKVPEDIRQAVRNNGGGAINHSLYWDIMAPNAGGEPTGDIAYAIKQSFSSFSDFKLKFSDAALTQFGSGWAWLVLNKEQHLEITKTSNQDNPLSNGKIPVLALDVWEHAYYLKYQNKRAEYIDAFYNVINWKKVDELYTTAKGSIKINSCGCC